MCCGQSGNGLALLSCLLEPGHHFNRSRADFCFQYLIPLQNQVFNVVSTGSYGINIMLIETSSGNSK
jgi:hypothetical protein